MSDIWGDDSLASKTAAWVPPWAREPEPDPRPEAAEPEPGGTEPGGTEPELPASDPETQPERVASPSADPLADPGPVAQPVPEPVREPALVPKQPGAGTAPVADPVAEAEQDGGPVAETAAADEPVAETEAAAGEPEVDPAPASAGAGEPGPSDDLASHAAHEHDDDFAPIATRESAESGSAEFRPAMPGPGVHAEPIGDTEPFDPAAEGGDEVAADDAGAPGAEADGAQGVGAGAPVGADAVPVGSGEPEAAVDAPGPGVHAEPAGDTEPLDAGPALDTRPIEEQSTEPDPFGAPPLSDFDSPSGGAPSTQAQPAERPETRPGEGTDTARDDGPAAAAGTPGPGDPTGAGDGLPPIAQLPTAELRAAIEAILLVVDDPVTEAALAGALEQPVERVGEQLTTLAEEYERQERGFDLRRAAGGWRLYTRPRYAGYVERFVLDGQSVRLTQAALETLAVVAYKQPVTRSRISAIRGVNCDGVMRTLVTRGLIEECGTEPETGAHLYRTTSLFLEKLGLDSVDQLPPLAPFLPDDVDEIADAQR